MPRQTVSIAEKMDNQKINIVEQITGVFINIDSVEEFEKILEDFPENSALHKAYADLLVKNFFSDEAALSYGRAAALYSNLPVQNHSLIYLYYYEIRFLRIDKISKMLLNNKLSRWG